MRSSLRATAAAAGALGLVIVLTGSCSDSDDEGGGGTTPPDPTGIVSGSVTLAAGGGVPGAELELTRSGATPRSRTTGADGSFSFTAVPVGQWSLSITPPGDLELAAGQSASVSVNVSDGQTSVADFELVEPAAPDATIVARAEVEGAARSGVTMRLFASGGSTVLDTETTNASGEAEFLVDAGAYDVQITVPNGLDLSEGEQARKPVTAVSEQSVTVTFALEPEPQGTVFEIEATSSFTFSPANPTISVGTTVRWTNTSNVLHTVTPDDHDEWASATLPSNGSTFSHTFDTPGEYPYFCEPHAPGMAGVITVE